MKQLAIALFFAVAAPAAWAGVLTVGPAGQFAQVSDALAAAQPGDAILVAPGTYQPFVVDKPVRVLGAGSSTTVIEGFSNGVLVDGIPAGAEAVVSGFEVRSNSAAAGIHGSVVVTNCAGTVLFHDLDVDSPFSQPALVLHRAERVVLQSFRAVDEGPASQTQGSSVVTALSSELWIVDSTISAGASGGGFALQGSHAVTVANGVLRVWSSELAGGDGVAGKGFFVTPQGGHAVSATGSEVVIHGGPGSELAGGYGAFGTFMSPGQGGSALVLANGSHATVQDQTFLVPGADATGTVLAPFFVLSGSSTVVQDPFVYPSLDAPAPQAAAGASVPYTLAGAPGAAVLVLASFHSGPTFALPGIAGVTFLDPLGFVAVATVALDPTGAGAFSLGLPPVAALLGAGLHLQGVQIDGAGLALTNPALTAIVR